MSTRRSELSTHSAAPSSFPFGTTCVRGIITALTIGSSLYRENTTCHHVYSFFPHCSHSRHLWRNGLAEPSRPLERVPMQRCCRATKRPLQGTAPNEAFAKTIQSWLDQQGSVASSGFQVTSITEVTSTATVETEECRRSSHLQTKNVLKLRPSSSSNPILTLLPSQCRVCHRQGHWGNECPYR